MFEKIKKLFVLACVLSTVIFLYSSIYIFYFDKFNRCLDVTYMWGVILLSAIMSLLRLPLMKDKEPSKAQMLIGEIVYFLLTNVLTMIFGKYLHWFSFEYPKSVVAMEICIVVVAFKIYLLMYISDRFSANKMNEKLKKLFCNCSEDKDE